MEATVEEPRSKEAVAREIEQNRLRIGLFLKEREQKRKASRPSKLVHALSVSREAAAKYKSKAMEKAAVADQSIRNQIYEIEFEIYDKYEVEVVVNALPLSYL